MGPSNCVVFVSLFWITIQFIYWFVFEDELFNTLYWLHRYTHENERWIEVFLFIGLYPFVFGVTSLFFAGCETISFVYEIRIIIHICEWVVRIWWHFQWTFVLRRNKFVINFHGLLKCHVFYDKILTRPDIYLISFHWNYFYFEQVNVAFTFCNQSYLNQKYDWRLKCPLIHDRTI